MYIGSAELYSAPAIVIVRYSCNSKSRERYTAKYRVRKLSIDYSL